MQNTKGCNRLTVCNVSSGFKSVRASTVQNLPQVFNTLSATCENSRSACFYIGKFAIASWLLRRENHAGHDEHADHTDRESHNAHDSPNNNNNKYYKKCHGKYDDAADGQEYAITAKRMKRHTRDAAAICARRCRVRREHKRASSMRRRV